jgi:hypothetical protein
MPTAAEIGAAIEAAMAGAVVAATSAGISTSEADAAVMRARVVAAYEGQRTAYLNSTTAVDALGVVTFTASVDHAQAVSYEVRIWTDPPGGSPVAVQNIGKPTPNGSNQILADLTLLFATLEAGAYVATAAAIDDEEVAYDSEESSAFTLPLA